MKPPVLTSSRALPCWDNSEGKGSCSLLERTKPKTNQSHMARIKLSSGLCPHPQHGGNFDSSFPCHEQRQDYGIAHTTSCERLVSTLWVLVVCQRAGDLCRQEVLNHRQGCSSMTWQHTTHETVWKENLGLIFSELIFSFQVQSHEVGNVHSCSYLPSFPTKGLLASGKIKRSSINHLPSCSTKEGSEETGIETSSKESVWFDQSWASTLDQVPEASLDSFHFPLKTTLRLSSTDHPTDVLAELMSSQQQLGSCHSLCFQGKIIKSPMLQLSHHTAGAPSSSDQAQDPGALGGPGWCLGEQWQRTPQQRPRFFPLPHVTVRSGIPNSA